MVNDEEFVQQLKALTQEFTSDLPGQIGALEATWVRLRREGWESPALTNLIQQLHSLTGEAGSLGFESIAQSASAMQASLENRTQGNISEHSGFEQIEDSFHSLREAVYSDQQVDLDKLVQRLDLAKAVSPTLQEKRAVRLVYIVDDDPIQAADLAAQVGYFGYIVQIFTTLGDLEGAIHQARPTVLLMDISFPEGRMAGYDTIQALQEKFSDLPPVIFISVNDAINFRLQAVRVGGKAYFTKPVDVGSLVDVIDRLVFHDTVLPFRVLIVEDSRVQANYISVQLKKAGMETEVAYKPLQLIDHLISFNPDLLLLDMYMPEVNGMELAQVIRQMEQFISIPIVFLSAEADKGKQLAALGIGGDDFLTKPIEPDHLIAAVTTRIERYRKLRTLMIHDGLTGLLNHSTIKERLSQEVERARRHHESLAFAMLDLDNFKLVNDHYGHAVGDRVLKSLAHMLRQRLRGSDTIGRFGGEEFAIIMPNSNELTAASIMQELCTGFAKIRHHADEKEFSVSFSCGVATFPDFDSASSLSEAADKATYAAKAAGRNNVKTASEYTGKEFSAAHVQPIATFQPSGLSHAALYQIFVRHANSAIIRFNPQGVITFANEFAQRFFGFSEEELVGHFVTGTLLPQTESHLDHIKMMIANIASHPDRYVHNENENLRKNGEKVWITWSNTPLVDENNNLYEILSIGNDITDRIRAETDLTRTVEYLSAINRISQTLMNQQNLLDAVTSVSQEVITLFRAQHVGIALLTEDSSALTFIGNSQTGWNIIPETPNQTYLPDEPASNQVVQSGKAIFIPDATHNPLLAETRALMQEHHINGRAIIPLNVKGKVVGVMNIDFEDKQRVFNDSELELAETIAGSIAGVIEIGSLFNAEQRQRQFFEALVKTIPVAVEMIDMQARIQSWNPAAEALFGYSPAEAIGQNIDDLLSTEDTRQEAVGLTQKSLQEGEFIHSITQRRRKDGSKVEVEVFAVLLSVNRQPVGSLAIYHDISELQRVRREAEAANAAKSSFLSTMSHEIRTPLNAIVGMTTLLQDTQLTAEQNDFTETIRSSSDALLTIINDILDFSKIEAGRMELEEQALDLRDCIESSFDLVASRATEKGIDLAYLLDPNVPSFIISDSTRLRQILLNLLSNSLKFTDQGEIVLSVSVEKPSTDENGDIRLHFIVRDTGIGIPAERKDRLFRSFSQVDASTTRKYGGTGLGLAISKRLCELMGGSMWVESEGIPGKGSSFHFTLQVKISTRPTPVFLHAQQPALTGRRVLIVDDNATNRYILMRQVLSWGMVPKETSDPHQALAWIRAGEEFDLVLLDMQMPEMDGVTLAAEIQHSSPKLADLPLVMLTSLGIREFDIGDVKFAAYLTKPIKPAVLYTTLLEVFGSHAVEKKRVKEKSSIASSSGKIPPLRILLAEDIVVNQKVALLLLDRIGCRADVVSNGLEVIEALHRQMYDVVLMDVQMPDMDGKEATRAIRSGAGQGSGSQQGDYFASQPYIIAMTANAMQGDREDCMASGMDDYISKPIQIEELAKALLRGAKSRAPVKVQPKQVIPQATSSVIDEDLFQKFQASLGEDTHSIMASLVEDFLTEAQQMVAELHSSALAGDVESARRAAHSLKSTSLMFGAEGLSQTCILVEKEADHYQSEQFKELCEKLDLDFESVKKALQAWLAENSFQAGN